MGLLSWDEVLGSSDLGTSTRQIQAALGRQFRAVPQAAPEFRQAAIQEGSRLARLREIGSSMDVANRRLGLQQQEVGLQQQAVDLKRGDLNLERREADRYASRLPWANLLGVGNVVIGGLSAYGNMAAMGRSEARAEQARQLQTERYGATAQGLQDLQTQQGRLADLYKQFIGRFPPP